MDGGEAGFEMRFRQGVRRAPAPLGAFFGFFQLGVATGVIHLQADGHRVFAFGAPGLQIVADANEARRSDEQPGFFGDFALGALLEGFAGIQMPAGDRPKGRMGSRSVCPTKSHLVG